MRSAGAAGSAAPQKSVEPLPVPASTEPSYGGQATAVAGGQNSVPEPRASTLPALLVK